MTGEPVPMPTTIAELWATGWVAENAEQADAQAQRMFDLFHGKRVAVDRLTFSHDDGEYDETLFARPWPEVWVDELSLESGWDGDVLYPEWYVRAADPDQIVTSMGGKIYRMGDLRDDYPLTTTAPGIGTAAGFGCKDRLIYPAGQEPPPAPADTA